MLVFHVLWFGLWVSVNVGLIPGVTPFDPFPFPFLTMTVSLEAIFVAWFVLASQNRLARESDKRSHLNLQIDMLTEREMTAVLRLLQDIARHLEVNTSVTPEQLRDVVQRAIGTGDELMSTAERLRKEGHSQGRSQLGNESVLRLLARRFGALPENIVHRVNAATLAELDRWTDRILDAKDLDDVFAAD